MFLSVIVSCHNCKDYIKRVLNSLVLQDFNDFEVIISDDNSTDNFMEIVSSYKQLLNIKYFKTEEHKYHCPGNTRRDGWKHATGEWITFMDHDDAFIPGAFKFLYNTVTGAEEKYNFMYSPVMRVNANGEEIGRLDAITWLHGNFYNRQWLIDNGIDFKEDLFGNEDLYFNNLVYAVLNGKEEKYWTVNTPFYQWYSLPESLSNTTPTNTDCGYTEKYFGDYLLANFEPYMIMLNRYKKKTEYYRNNILRLFIYSYFYYERALFTFKDEKVISKMLEDIKKTFEQYKESDLHGSKEELITAAFGNVDEYIKQRETIFELSGKFIETHSFKEFLNIINNGNNK